MPNKKYSFTEEQISELFSITKMGHWVWYLKEERAIISREWADIFGIEEVSSIGDIMSWGRCVHPEDLFNSALAMQNYLGGESPVFESEARMIKKDGTIFWTKSRGKITEYDEDGKPSIIIGVLQDISNIKSVSDSLLENEKLLNTLTSVVGFGTWDWNIISNQITYNDVFYNMFGYDKADLSIGYEAWKAILHPDDVENTISVLDDFLKCKKFKFECETRIRHKNGHYIWTKYVGVVVEKDEKGNSIRAVGGHFDINDLKLSQNKVSRAMKALEVHKVHLEEQIETRTKALLDQSSMLMTVNELSQQLVSIERQSELNDVIVSGLQKLCEFSNRDTILVWRVKEKNGVSKNNLEFSWNFDLEQVKNNFKKLHENTSLEELTNGIFTDEQIVEFVDFVFSNSTNSDIIIFDPILDRDFVTFGQGKPINSLSKNLSNYEQFFTKLCGIKAILAYPIFLKNKFWGYIVLCDKKSDRLFNKTEEQMLNISGTILASTIERTETDEKLRLAHEEALTSSKAKTNFLANMSHEIRTPMNAISGMSDIILRESDDQGVLEYASSIKNAAGSLISIINNILDISKIESGKLEIIESEYNFITLINDLISMARIRLTNKPVTLFVHIESTLPTILIGDEVRVKQIFINILNNAIKFTKTGHIEFIVKGAYKNGEVDLNVDVIDTGIGIKQEDMGRLFEQFERLNTKKNRQIEGTGLGLPIAKQLCEFMGGSVSAKSEYNVGSTFSVNIKQKYDNYQPIAQVETKKSILLYETRPLYLRFIKDAIENLGSECVVCSNQSQLYDLLNERTFDFIFTPALHLQKVKMIKSKQNFNAKIILIAEFGYAKVNNEVFALIAPLTCISISDALNNKELANYSKQEDNTFIAPQAKVLIVDDSPVNLKVAQGLMKPYKFQIETAVNGLEAVNMVKNNVYDMVFMDHMMPEMDGIDATNEIRKMTGNPYFANLPIIALTANAIVGVRELFINEGMNDFLAKPIEINNLNEILLKWIPKNKQESVKVSDVQNESCNTDKKIIEIDEVDTVSGLRLLDNNYDDYIDILKTFLLDGLKKKLSLNEHFKNNNIDAFRIEIHAVKSASATIGALKIFEQARLLELAAIENDMVFLRQNVREFLDDFEVVLDNIGNYVNELNDEDEAKIVGDISMLQEKLRDLTDAVYYVDIEIIDKVLEELFKFDWGSEIFSLLSSVKEYISAYEYDETLPLVEKIYNIISKEKSPIN